MDLVLIQPPNVGLILEDIETNTRRMNASIWYAITLRAFNMDVRLYGDNLRFDEADTPFQGIAIDLQREGMKSER